jgi:signal transduction histidine kinase
MDVDDAPEVTHDVAVRAEEFARGADLGAVVEVLRGQRHAILADWLAIASRQPMHEGRGGRAIADHIPSLFDALVDVLERAAPWWINPVLPLEYPAVLDAAQRHARSRFEQGLSAADVVTEFRLLRQEVGRALRTYLPADVPTGDVLAAELLVHDALDAATSLALTSLGQELDELREDVLATTVHDVQQPMATLKGRLQFAIRLLSRGDADVERATTMLRQADREIDRMSLLLAGLGQASRVAVGRLEIRPEPADMREFVRAALDRLDPETHARCRFEVASDAVTTGTWDAGLVERVLGNLLSNAAKYSQPDSPIHVELSNLDEAIHVAVRDFGTGLTQDELGQLFQRYTRTQRATEGGAPGAGLGLYVCRGIVEAHGGRIWAESDGVGHGATFHVILRRDSEGDTATTEASCPASAL